MVKKGSQKVQFSDGSVFLSPEERKHIDVLLSKEMKSHKDATTAQVRARIKELGQSDTPTLQEKPKKPVTGNITRAIRETIRVDPHLSLKQIADKLHTSKNYVRNVRKALVKTGKVEPVWRSKK